MVKQRKYITAAYSKDTSKRLRTATLGTHIPRRFRSSRMNADTVGFSSARKQRRAARGYVDNILAGQDRGRRPSTNKGGFALSGVGHMRLRRIAIPLLCVMVVVVVATVVGLTTFFGSLDAKLALKDSNASTALVPPKLNGDPVYTLLEADLDNASSPTAPAGLDAIALVRLDTTTAKVSVVSIPATLAVTLKDGKTHALCEASSIGGDAALIGAVADFAGVSVSHFVKVDAAGVVAAVDTLGGISVDLSEEVDDPAAGSEYIPSGEQHLGGKAALTLLRAQNFKAGLETQAKNQQAVLASVVKKLIGTGNISLLSSLDKTGGSFTTDMRVGDLISFAEKLRITDHDKVQGAFVPGTQTQSGGQSLFVVTKTAWDTMKKALISGEELLVSQALDTVDPASFTLTVRNGGGITGAAAQMQKTLTGLGFKVTDTGNTDSSVYKDTLVVYKDKDKKACAQTVVSALGMGRTVFDTGFYSFDTDVLLILGKDWKPST